MENIKEIALNIAETAFAGKKDKEGMPYIEHLKRVSENSKNYLKLQYAKNKEDDEIVEVVGLLHDLIEDCPEWTLNHLKGIFKNFSIIDAIDRLTKHEGLSYEEYIHNVNNCKYSRAVKLADLKDNMDITRLKYITDADVERLVKYHKSYKFLIGENK